MHILFSVKSGDTLRRTLFQMSVSSLNPSTTTILREMFFFLQCVKLIKVDKLYALIGRHCGSKTFPLKFKDRRGKDFARRRGRRRRFAGAKQG